jgi:sulfate adenylyltransferase subunit 2
MRYNLTHLQTLESEAIHIMRECAAMAERPVLLFSGGKDSIVMLRLAEKAFRPARFPFPLMHVDTGHNFPEVIKFRDETAERLGERLIVASVEDSIKEGKAKDTYESEGSRNRIQSVTLVDAIEKHEFDAVFGGARRDEEKARAKERVFSFRDEFGGWEPKDQRPELWNLYNGHVRTGEHMRVFPLSNWTELDVWQYLRQEEIPIPQIYFSHQREVYEHKGMLLAVSPFTQPKNGEAKTETVRFRTIGDITCTGAVRSEAANIDQIVEEIAAARVTERGGRADDRFSETAMEDRKKEGYF